MFDFHTHRLDAPAGEAIICLPAEVLRRPDAFEPHEGALYAAGVHPWATEDEADARVQLQGLPRLLAHPQVVMFGECGLDRLRGGAEAFQIEIFEAQIALAERFRLPVTLHVVRAWDALLRLHRSLRPTTQWTVHGFRGKPVLARQLLDAGIDLSFGARYDPESFLLTPPERRHRESDAI